MDKRNSGFQKDEVRDMPTRAAVRICRAFDFQKF
jgi:hypothetical protein